MKKKTLLVPLALLLALSLVAAGCPPPAQVPEVEEVEVIELSMATFWPAVDFQVTEGHIPWIEEIEAATGGRVKITLHPGGALLGGREIYAGVVDGIADIGVSAYAYTPGKFPLMEAFELPAFLNPSALVASLTVHEAYKQMKPAELADVKVMFHWATGPGDLMLKRPVHTLEDLAGMKIRAVGGTAHTMKKLGATPVSMPMPDAYLALEAGIVDGILAPTDVLKGFRLAEVTSYVTKAPFLYNIVFFKVMNLDTWNALPDDIKTIFGLVNERWARWNGEIRTKHTVIGLEYGIAEHGMEVIHLTAEEEARWKALLEPVVEEWIAKREAEGLPGRQVIDLIRELDAKYAEKYGEM